MMPSPQPGAAALRFNLTLPSTTVNLGAVTIDPLALLLGDSLEKRLFPLMVAPRQQRSGPDGRLQDVYPLSVPAGTACGLTLSNLELSIGNDQGNLSLIVPMQVETWVFERVRPYLTAQPERVISPERRAILTKFLLRLPPGARASILLEGLGEVGIEAA